MELTTGPLSAGPNAFTARAADAAGNTSAASSALTVTVTAPSGTVTLPLGVGAPTIASFTTDSGVAGDHITNDSTLTLSGSAVANSTVTSLTVGNFSTAWWPLPAEPGVIRPAPWRNGSL